jgi:hypothetical protein
MSDLMRYYEELADKENARVIRERNDETFPAAMIPIGALVLDNLAPMLGEGVTPLREVWAGSPLHLEAALSCVRRADRETAADEINKAWALCESPIERCLAPWLVMQDFMAFPCPNRVVVLGDEPIVEGELRIVPQLPIEGYRIDFMLIAQKADRTRWLAVECDGAEYHDSSRDFYRDQALTDLGIATLRATGSEIVHHPRRVALRAARYFCDWGLMRAEVQKALAPTGEQA